MILNPRIINILQANLTRKNILSKNRNNAAIILKMFCKRMDLYLPNYKYTSIKQEQPVTTIHPSSSQTTSSNDHSNDAILKKNGSAAIAIDYDTNMNVQSSPDINDTTNDELISDRARLKPLYIKCEVMARIPTVLYRYKDIQQQIRQEKEYTMGRPLSSNWIRRKTKRKKTIKVDENELIMVPTSNFMEYEMIPRRLLSSEQIQKYQEEMESYVKKRKLASLQVDVGDRPTSSYMLIPNTFPQPIPSKNGKEMFLYGYGESKSSRKMAQNLAALEIIYQMELIFGIERGTFRDYSISNVKKFKKVTASYEVVPYYQFFPGITWKNVPIDRSFVLWDRERKLLHKPQRQKQSKTSLTLTTIPRDGNINFSSKIRNNESTQIIAKIITLSSTLSLPTVDIRYTKRISELGTLYANIQPMGGPFINIIKNRPDGVKNIGLDSLHAQFMALTYWYDTMKYENPSYNLIKHKKKERCIKMIDAMTNLLNTSYGMAKIFISLPLHQFDELQILVKSITPRYNFPNNYKDSFLGIDSNLQQEHQSLQLSLSQLILHNVQRSGPITGEQLIHFLADIPDTPPEPILRQSIRDLISQGLLHIIEDSATSDLLKYNTQDKEERKSKTIPEEHLIQASPLGYAVNEFPVDPRIGRMLMMGLVLRAMNPSLTIAALLSVPEVFRRCKEKNTTDKIVNSDIIHQIEAYRLYTRRQRDHPNADIFDQVSMIRNDLKRMMKQYLMRRLDKRDANDVDITNNIDWNWNSRRVAAQASLICSATSHVAHLVHGADDEFATTTVAGTAKIHPSSVNYNPTNRSHWYVYKELRYDNEVPYLYTTTAVSPLEIALFCDADMIGPIGKMHRNICRFEHIRQILYDENWLFHIDQWIPVVASIPKQIDVILRLRQILIYDMLQRVALDPITFAENEKYMQLVQYILSAIEQQRLLPEIEQMGLYRNKS